MLGMLIQVLVGMTDTAFLGRVGEVELGASALGGVIFLFVFMIICLSFFLLLMCKNKKNILVSF